MSPTNAQKAQRLEEMANVCIGSDAALLRESAAMWREREKPVWIQVGWRTPKFIGTHRGRTVEVVQFNNSIWSVWSEAGGIAAEGVEQSVAAAQAAAVAWVDANAEGK
jgi:hypothetical protein